MSDPQENSTDTLFGIISKCVAGLVFLSFVVGFAYSHGWHRGFGLLVGGTFSEEMTSFLGFAAIFSLVPAMLKAIFVTLYQWQTWVIALSLNAALFAFIKFKKSEKAPVPEHISSKQFVLFFAGAIVVMSPIEAMKLGEAAAKKQLDEFIEHGCDFRDDGWGRCHVVEVDGKTLKQGYLVTKADKTISLFNESTGKLELITVPDSAILSRAYQQPDKTN